MSVQLSTPLTRVRAPWPPLLASGAVMAWISVVLLLDSDGSLGQQRALGLVTWGVLALALSRETPLVRVQTVVVVGFATAVEYTFSPLLEVYTYRFDNVPMYVPPGHGLVYMAALWIGRSAWVAARERLLLRLVLVTAGAYAAYGLLLTDRTDVLGAFWYLCLAGFLVWGPSRGLYIGAFVVVTYLEIAGTALGTWTWAEVDPTGLVPIGNPPSGAAGGYGWFDLTAIILSPALVRAWWRLTPRPDPVADPAA